MPGERNDLNFLLRALISTAISESLFGRMHESAYEIVSQIYHEEIL